MSKQTYSISEIFYSLQGEGGRAGEPSIFVRFQGCNMQCDIEPGPLSPGGFMCDTEFQSGRKYTLEELVDTCRELSPNCHWLVLTGGEPGLQVDTLMIDYLKNRGFMLAIESNGTISLPEGLDWVTISPKVAEHAVKQKTASEVKYVRAEGQEIPKPACMSGLKYISPAWGPQGLERRNLLWCIELVKRHPDWRLSLQQHKIFGVR